MRAKMQIKNDGLKNSRVLEAGGQGCKRRKEHFGWVQKVTGQIQGTQIPTRLPAVEFKDVSGSKIGITCCSEGVQGKGPCVLDNK